MIFIDLTVETIIMHCARHVFEGERLKTLKRSRVKSLKINFVTHCSFTPLEKLDFTIAQTKV